MSSFMVFNHTQQIKVRWLYLKPLSYYFYSMYGKRFEKEFMLVENALKSEAGEKEIREYLKPVIISVVEEYLAEHPDFKNDQENITNACWTYLQTALKKYKGRAELMTQGKNDIYYFTSYFNWFARQGILDYIHKKAGANTKPTL
jgi:hypothetical protein